LGKGSQIELIRTEKSKRTEGKPLFKILEREGKGDSKRKKNSRETNLEEKRSGKRDQYRNINTAPLKMKREKEKVVRDRDGEPLRIQGVTNQLQSEDLRRTQI